MSNFCLRRFPSFFLVIIFLGLLLLAATPIQAVTCPNGSCQPSQGETCETCPEDCGPCPTSTPEPTTPSGSDSSSSSSGSDASSAPAVIIYPSVTLNLQNLLFRGNASISQGTIASVEYSLDDGQTWLPAAPQDGGFDQISENYLFSAPNAFTLGSHKVITRAKSGDNIHTHPANYAVLSFTVLPPKITLAQISPNPTKDQTPTLAGTATTNFLKIASVQISLDDGQTWLPAKLAGSSFSLTTKILEDGNYPIKARAFDIAGNMSQSDSQILIVDTIPPVIGGNLTALGSQILTPDGQGAIHTVAEAQNTIIVSLRGGPTQVTLAAQNETFDLNPIKGTNLWRGQIVFSQPAEKPIEIMAVDGAGNTTQRQLGPFLIEESGQVINAADNSPIDKAQVSLYLFEVSSHSWVLWDSSAFGQKNPQETDSGGGYHYIVPSGRYYLEVKAPQFRTMRSQIFDLATTTTLTTVFPLSPQPKISFQLPLLGKISFPSPLASFSQSLGPTELTSSESTKLSLDFGLKRGINLPFFSLPDPTGQIVSSSNYQDRSLILTFLSTWAPPSIEQALILNQTYPLLNQNQSSLAVFVQDSAGEVETFLERGDYHFPTLIDQDGLTAADFQLSTLPQHFFINSQGVIADTFIGVLNQAELLEKLNQLD